MKIDKLQEVLNKKEEQYNNDPELVKTLLDYKGKQGHEKIQKRLFKKLINNYIEINKKLDKKVKKITKLSETDQLTKIYNRVKFKNELDKEIKRIKRYNNDLAIIMFDIDHFKQVNDNYGHDIGDKVLIKITNEVSKIIRETDIFARWGGEEFMILTPDTNLESAIGLAERIRKNIEKEEINKVGQITCSFGVTCFKKGDTFNSFTKRVDNALYQAKESGRNTVIDIK